MPFMYYICSLYGLYDSRPISFLPDNKMASIDQFIGEGIKPNDMYEYNMADDLALYFNKVAEDKKRREDSLRERRKSAPAKVVRYTVVFFSCNLRHNP